MNPDKPSEAAKKGKDGARFWAAQIVAAGKTERDWLKDADRITERYKNEKKRRKTTFPIFWSNVQVLKPNVYSALPRPDVRRRAVHEDPMIKEIGRQAAILVESALAYEIDNEMFSRALERARDDMLIVGRGVVREVYAADTVRRPADPAFETADGEDEDGVPYIEQVENERTETRYVFWSDFRMSPARSWDDVWWVAFRHAMDRDQLEEEFGAKAAAAVPKLLPAHSDQKTGPKVDSMPADPESPFSRAEVWEIWSKKSKERIWIATGHEDHVLRRDVDPLRLAGFFPCPCPIYAAPTTDTMVPMPELQIYETLADELDEVQDRRRRLVKAMKVVELTDGDFIEGQSIAAANDGDMIPIDRGEVTAGEIGNAVWTRPVDRYVTTLVNLTSHSESLKQAIYELTGISDLRRGIGQERESATAQKLKASYGSARMTPRSKPMAEFCKGLLRIKAEIIVEHFDPETLAIINGGPVAPPVLALLQEERFRNTVIDIETDSTVAPDAEQDKADANEFVTAITGYLTAAVQVGMAAPPTLPLLLSIMRAAAKTYKFSRNIEQELDALADPAAAAAAVPPQQPPQPGNGAAQPGMMQ